MSIAERTASEDDVKYVDISSIFQFNERGNFWKRKEIFAIYHAFRVNIVEAV